MIIKSYLKKIEKSEYRKIKIKLFNIIERHNKWNKTESQKEKEAKDNLVEFYQELIKHKPSTYYELGYTTSSFEFHTSYIYCLIIIKDALDKKNYQGACNEIGSMISREPIFQKRIYINLKELLEKSLNIHSEHV